MAYKKICHICNEVNDKPKNGSLRNRNRNDYEKELTAYHNWFTK